MSYSMYICIHTYDIRIGTIFFQATRTLISLGVKAPIHACYSMIKRKKNNKDSYDDFSCFPLRTHLLAIFWFQDAVSPPRYFRSAIYGD
jgi:hypothetical protein